MNVVGDVAVLAPRSVRGVPVQRLSVNTGVEIQQYIVVAVSAVDALQFILVGKVFDIGVLMAVDALQVAVCGLQESRIVDVQRDRSTVPLFLELGIVVAIEAGIIVDSS